MAEIKCSQQTSRDAWQHLKHLMKIERRLMQRFFIRNMASDEARPSGHQLHTVKSKKSPNLPI